MNLRYYDFDFLMHRSAYRLYKKQNEPLYIKQYISKIALYVQELKSNNPNLSIDELEKIFDKDYSEILDTIFNNGFILDNSMAYESCIYFLDKRDKFNNLVEEYNNNPENFPEDYSTVFNDNLKHFISEAKKEYDDFMESEDFNSPQLKDFQKTLANPSISNNEKNKICNSISCNLSYSSKKVFEKFADCSRNGEFAYLKYMQKYLEESLRNDLIESICSIGNQLQKLGFLENYPKFQEKALNNSLSIFGFSHTLNSSKHDYRFRSFI